MPVVLNHQKNVGYMFIVKGSLWCACATNGLGANRETKYLAAYAQSVIIERRALEECEHV
jgi:hypothetical protein